MPHAACPICRDGILEQREGRLDQSGDSFLPTVALRCPRCEYTRFQPAVHARWVSWTSPGAKAAARKPDVTEEALAA